MLLCYIKNVKSLIYCDESPEVSSHAWSESACVLFLIIIYFPTVLSIGTVGFYIAR